MTITDLLLAYDFTLDQGEQAVAHRHRGYEQAAIVITTTVGGQGIEELDQIGGQIITTGEHAEVGVDTSCGRIIVSGTHVGVAADALLFPPHHQGQFGVDFDADQAIDDMDTGSFKGTSPDDIVLFIEACFELYDRSDLFALLTGVHEGTHDW